MIPETAHDGGNFIVLSGIDDIGQQRGVHRSGADSRDRVYFKTFGFPKRQKDFRAHRIHKRRARRRPTIQLEWSW